RSATYGSEMPLPPKPCKGEIINHRNDNLAPCGALGVETQCIASLQSGGCAALHRRLCTFHPCGIRK
ncbi:MAG: hypothetical protein LBT09_00415, partial [Planctomycetaceae bacterium]|nr:hypothetical protein [Planctomycetaceae bacterium]